VGSIEANVRHDLVFGHESKACTLKVVRGESVLVQLGWEARLVPFVLGQHLNPLGRSVVQFVVIAAKHSVKAANGLMAMQYIIRRIHSAFCPATEVGHEIFLIAAVQGLAVDANVGTRNTFQGDDQHISRPPWCREQFLSVQIELSKPRHLRWNIDNITLQPLFCACLNIANARGHQLMWQVEQAPLVFF